MSPKCPYCETRIRAKDVDPEHDSVLCRRCGRSLSFSALPGVVDNPALRRMLARLQGGPVGREPAATPARTGDGASLATGESGPAPLAATAARPGGLRVTPPGHAGSSVNLAAPPAGAWYRDDGMTLEVGASTRSIGLAIVMLLVGTFWCSVTGVFVIVALTGIAQGLGLAGGGNHGGGAGVAVSVFMLLFSTPFVFVGWWMFWTALMSMGGREVVRIRGDALEQFSGVGPVGFRKHLSAASVRRVDLDVKVTRSKNGTSTTKTVALHTDSPKPLKFGAMLREDRRNFVLESLRQILAPQGGRVGGPTRASGGE